MRERRGADAGEPRLVRVRFLVPAWAHAQVLVPGRILVRRDVRPSAGLVAHELVHVDQARRLGLPRYWLAYGWGLLRHGYARHPMELEARRLARTGVYLERARALLDRHGAA